MRCFLFLLFAAALLRAEVIVVDATGAGDFDQIHDAINAAAEGDTVLVKGTGPYSSDVHIIGKSLVIEGDPEAEIVFGQAYVTGLAAGQRVVLRGISLKGYPWVPGIELEDNAGSVWIEDCISPGGPGNGLHIGCAFGNTHPGGAGLSAANCDSVVVVRSQLTGGPGDNWSVFGSNTTWRTDGGPGAKVVDASVAFYECELGAGQGGISAGPGSVCGPPANGGAGLVVESGEVLLSQCDLVGGQPGTDGLGGDGLVLEVGSLVQTLEGSVVPGPGGTTIVNGGGTLQDFVGTARSFAVTSTLREGEAGTLSMQGLQGDSVAFFWSFGAGSLPMPHRKGWFVLDTSFFAGPFLVGTIADPGGTWDLPFLAPDLVPGLDAQTFLLQAYFAAAAGGVTLASGTAFTLVDSSL